MRGFRSGDTVVWRGIQWTLGYFHWDGGPEVLALLLADYHWTFAPARELS